MKILQIAGFIIAILTGCNDSGSSNGRSVATDRSTTTRDERSDAAAEDRDPNSSNPLLGEWFQQYAVLDQAGNAVLDPEDRNGTKSSMGFNYFQFNENGTCLWDSDAKFRGNYEIEDDQGKKQLRVTVNGFGETYTYNIVEPVSEELVLYSTGVFLIYKRK